MSFGIKVRDDILYWLSGHPLQKCVGLVYVTWLTDNLLCILLKPLRVE